MNRQWHLPGLLILAGALPLAAAADGNAPLMVRTHIGVHACTSIVTGESCGSDRWSMTVLSDGTRILQNSSSRPQSGGLLTMTLQVDGDFRPVDAFESIYSDGEWLGAGHFSADDRTLRMSISGPDGYFTRTLDTPETYSLLLHPPAADGWHFAFYDKERGGEQEHAVCSVGRARQGLACAFLDVTLGFVGTERLSVPAGTFNTEHYRFGDGTEVWLSGPDRIVVRHVFGAAGSRTELVALSTDSP